MKFLLALMLIISSCSYFNPKDIATEKEVMDAQAMGGTFELMEEDLLSIPLKSTSMLKGLTTLPKDYSFKDNPCMPRIRNQGGCGSCWAFAASYVMDARYCLANDNKMTEFSTEELVRCDNKGKNNGCKGGHFIWAWDSYGKFPGDTLESCKKYTAKSHTGNTRLACAPKCNDDSTIKRMPISSYYRIKGETEIMREIYDNGPVAAAMYLYSGFYGHKGVYIKDVTKTPVGGHGVTIIGWGEQNQLIDGKLILVKYWEVANSWGSNWNDDGIFKIRRGTNEAYIESYIAAPLFSSVPPNPPAPTPVPPTPTPIPPTPPTPVVINPIAEMTTLVSYETEKETFYIDVKFNTPVTGFSLLDLERVNVKVDSLTGSGINYKIKVSPQSKGQFVVLLKRKSVTAGTVNNNYAHAYVGKKIEREEPTPPNPPEPTPVPPQPEPPTTIIACGSNGRTASNCYFNADAIKAKEAKVGDRFVKFDGESWIYEGSDLFLINDISNKIFEVFTNNKLFATKGALKITGKVCPVNTWLSKDEEFAVNKCLYVTSMQGVGSYIRTGLKSSWNAGNTKTCLGLGMRLPTIYETNTRVTSSALYPKDGKPIFAGNNGVSSSGDSCSATGASSDRNKMILWNNRTVISNYSYKKCSIRCVFAL